jgi:hypothetical protein
VTRKQTLLELQLANGRTICAERSQVPHRECQRASVSGEVKGWMMTDVELFGTTSFTENDCTTKFRRRRTAKITPAPCSNNFHLCKASVELLVLVSARDHDTEHLGKKPNAW